MWSLHAGTGMKLVDCRDGDCIVTRLYARDLLEISILAFGIEMEGDNAHLVAAVVG